MADISQEQALAVLKEAKEKGTLDPSIEKGLAELIGLEERPKVKEVLEAPVVAEAAESSEPAGEEKPRELSPEQQTELLSALETRFAEEPNHYKRLKNVNFIDVKASLEANPALMYSLAQMEETGGAPDLIDVEGDAFIFGDCSAESPDRRDLTYDQAAEMAKEFGVDMMPEEVYRAMQESGKFDINTWSWLAMPADVRESGRALCGGCYVGGVYVLDYGAENPGPNLGWRGVLRVPKA